MLHGTAARHQSVAQPTWRSHTRGVADLRPGRESAFPCCLFSVLGQAYVISICGVSIYHKKSQESNPKLSSGGRLRTPFLVGETFREPIGPSENRCVSDEQSCV